MRLIAELNEEVQYLSEEKDGKRTLYIEGCFLQANIKNRNGRIYPMSIMEREVGKYHSEKISHGRAMGELGHPATPGLNLDRVSHIVTECKRSGNDFIGKAKILPDLPMGKIAEGLIQAGAKLGVSSRGMGSLKEDSKLGAMVVQDDFNLAVMIDIVADPSAPGAWVNGVMENVEWVRNAQGEWVQRQLESIKEAVHATPSADLDRRKVELFNGYIAAMTEQTMVDALAKSGKIEKSRAAEILKRAKIKAKVTGQHADSRFVWATAKGMLDEEKDEFVSDLKRTFMSTQVSGGAKHDPKKTKTSNK